MIAQQVKLVVIALKLQVNVPLLVLGKRVNMIHTAELVNIVVALMEPARQIVLGKFVYLTTTAHRQKPVVV